MFFNRGVGILKDSKTDSGYRFNFLVHDKKHVGT